MMSDSTILVLSALLTWLMVCNSSGLRIRAREPGGMERAFGNRDNLPEPTPIAGRADRAAKNMVENLAMFVALLAAVHFAGRRARKQRLAPTSSSGRGSPSGPAISPASIICAR